MTSLDGFCCCCCLSLILFEDYDAEGTQVVILILRSHSARKVNLSMWFTNLGSNLKPEAETFFDKIKRYKNSCYTVTSQEHTFGLKLRPLGLPRFISFGCLIDPLYRLQPVLLKQPIRTIEVKSVVVTVTNFAALNNRRPMLIHYVVAFPVCQHAVLDEIPEKIEIHSQRLISLVSWGNYEIFVMTSYIIYRQCSS